MAVEANHLHPLPPVRAHQPPPAAAAAAAAAVGGEGMFSRSLAACYGGGVVAGGGEQVMQGYQPYLGGGAGGGGVVRQLPPPPAAASGALVGLQGQYSPFCGGVDAAESGVTFGSGQEAAAAVAAPRKRKRAEQPLVLGAAADASVAAQARQQLVDADRLVLHHTAKMWAELAEQRRRHARQMVAAVEAAAAKRLRAKDEEIERIGRLNWALEERLKGMYVEAQVWRDVAQSNEATANALRGELQHALDAQARCGARGGAAGDDAESCCYGENDVPVPAGGEEDEEEAGTKAPAELRGAPRCKGCGEAAAVVLLLPCRHLCACAPCAVAARACPACGCAKNGSVCVNFS